VKNPQKRKKSTKKNKSTKKKKIHKIEERGEIWYPLQIVWIKVNFMYLLEI